MKKHKIKRLLWSLLALALIFVSSVTTFFIGRRSSKADFAKPYEEETFAWSNINPFEDKAVVFHAAKGLVSKRCYVSKAEKPKDQEGFRLGDKNFRSAAFSNKQRIAFSKVLFESQRIRHNYIKDLALATYVSEKEDEEFASKSPSAKLASIKSMEKYFENLIYISKEDVDKYYASIKDKLSSSMKRENMESSMRQHLFGLEKQKQMQTLLREFRDEAKTSYYLNDVCPPKLSKIDSGEYRAFGAERNADLSWDLIVFTRYSSLESRAAWPQIEALLLNHSDKLRLTIVPYGKDNNKLDALLARASYCSPDISTLYRNNFHSFAFGVPFDEFRKKVLDTRKVIKEHILPKFKDGDNFGVLSCESSTKPNSAYYKGFNLTRDLGVANSSFTMILNGRVLDIEPSEIFETLDVWFKDGASS